MADKLGKHTPDGSEMEPLIAAIAAIAKERAITNTGPTDVLPEDVVASCEQITAQQKDWDAYVRGSDLTPEQLKEVWEYRRAKLPFLCRAFPPDYA